MTLAPGLRRGTMALPPSKSHAHRVLLADFLAGRTDRLSAAADDCDDLAATKRCLAALSQADAAAPVSLDVGESGTTRRLLGPVVAALGLTPEWISRGRLAARPQLDYSELTPGVQTLPGDVSSQFVSGLLFALPLLAGDSEIRLTTPLQSRGYVAMTCDVLAAYGIVVDKLPQGYRVPGRQRFVAPSGGVAIESDWSAAAFPLAMKALGNEVEIAAATRLSPASRQPDRVVADLLPNLPRTLDVAEFPDSFPVLSVVAAHRAGETVFSGIGRLRIKECDRVAAMAEVLTRFGAGVDVAETTFRVWGTGAPFAGGAFRTFGDHRIAMSVAVGATCASAPVALDDAACAAKSFPGFFAAFNRLVRQS